MSVSPAVAAARARLASHFGRMTPDEIAVELNNATLRLESIAYWQSQLPKGDSEERRRLYAERSALEWSIKRMREQQRRRFAVPRSNGR